MRTIAIVLICLLIVTAAASSAFAGGKPGVSYVVSNPNHTQKLGGKSTQACKGLQVAALKSEKVQMRKGAFEGGGSFDPSPVEGK